MAVQPKIKKLSRRYPSTEDVFMRLKNTVIMINRRPAFVRTIEDKDLIEYTDIQSGADFHADPNDPETVDLRSPRLGWVNGKVLTYVMRQPRNSQRQGLVLNRLLSFRPSLFGDEVRQGFPYGGTQALQDLSKTILGDYPGMGTRKRDFAISRDWAFLTAREGWFSVYHKTVGVGGYHRESQRFLIHKRFLNKTRLASLENVLLLSGRGLNLSQIEGV